MPRLAAFLIVIAVAAAFFSRSTKPVHAEPATILLVLEPRKPSGGKWDMGVGADPVVCVGRGCYQSRGFDSPARFFKNRSIFVPGVRAAKCRNSLVCVFRNVNVPETGADIQPVDLDGLQHDLLTRKFSKVDQSCELRRGRITCDNGLYAPGYALWIVPEALAQAAGRKALDFALFKGIQDYKEDYMAEYLRHQRRGLAGTAAKFYSAVIGEKVPASCVTSPDLIAEAFHLSGLVNPARDPSKGLFDEFVESVRIAPVLKSVKDDPKKFWWLHETMDRFEVYSGVTVVQTMKGTDAVRFVPNANGRDSLLVGWAIKSRAKALVADCLERGA